MKFELSDEQVQVLIKLGVGDDNITTVSEWSGCIPFTRKTITLHNLLEILPPYLYFEEGVEESSMVLIMNYEEVLEKWVVAYSAMSDRYRGVEFQRHAPELIDALYDLAVWAIEYKNILH